MYKKILVPLDGSALAECVLPHVESIIKGCDAPEVVFIRVAPHAYTPTGGEYLFTEKDIKRIEAAEKETARDYLDELKPRTKFAGAKSSTLVKVGNPAETIADYAAKNGVDLIIIATHGRTGVSRWVFGSVAHRVLHAACVPVLMVRAPGCVPGI